MRIPDPGTTGGTYGKAKDTVINKRGTSTRDKPGKAKTKRAVAMPKVKTTKRSHQGISGSVDPKWWKSLSPARKKAVLAKMNPTQKT